MAKWAADFSVATEVSRNVINLILERFITALKQQLQFARQLGNIGSFSAEVTSLKILDIEDPPPVGGVVTDLEALANFQLKLFGITITNTTLTFSIEDVEIDLSTTPAGLPKGIIIKVTPTMNAKLSFANVRFVVGWLLNSIIAPLVTFGIWLAFRIIRKVEIPVWDLVDIFGALGLRFAPGSPLLTAQKIVPPSSILLASDFNLTNPLIGKPNDLEHFLPALTNLGAVVHERVITAAVQIAFTKGWVPSRTRVGKWKIYINSIGVQFEQDKIIASGTLKAKRGKCWCKVKVRIHFKAAIEPKVTDVNTPHPKIEFKYDADINVHISTSGMLVVLGFIMFAPVFMALTIAMSFLENIDLKQFLPFKTVSLPGGGTLKIQAISLNDPNGFVPFSMNFPLQLKGSGEYDLSRFQQFNLPVALGQGQGNVQFNVGFTTESLSIQKDELRVAIDLK